MEAIGKYDHEFVLTDGILTIKMDTPPDNGKKAIPVPDLYVLKGEDKELAIKIIYRILELEGIEDETVFACYRQLQGEATRRAKRWHDIAGMHSKKIVEMQNKALENYKLQVRVDFTTKYATVIQSGHVTKSMMNEWRLIEQQEQHSCYAFDGLRVQRRDCKLCDRVCRFVGGA